MKLDWEKLIANKPFEALTEQEKAFIRAEMSPLEYEQLRQVWQETALFFDQEEAQLPLPDPAIRLQVRDHMRTLAPTSFGGRIRALLDYRVPAYQAIAAGVILLAMVHFGSKALPDHTGPSYGGTTMMADSTIQDSSVRTGFNLYEDSVFSKFMIEAF